MQAGKVNEVAGKKLRHSRQREMIYAYLLSTKEHPSAETVYEDLRAKIPNLSLGTVYRNLKLLEELGQVRRVTTLQNVERYDARCDDHAHFVCRECGCVKDLEAIDAAAVGKACGMSGADQVQWTNVTLGGMCAQCAAG